MSTDSIFVMNHFRFLQWLSIQIILTNPITTTSILCISVIIFRRIIAIFLCQIRSFLMNIILRWHRFFLSIVRIFVDLQCFESFLLSRSSPQIFPKKYCRSKHRLQMYILQTCNRCIHGIAGQTTQLRWEYAQLST